MLSYEIDSLYLQYLIIKDKVFFMRKNDFYFRYRSAITGLYVTESYAKRHPKTTVKEKYSK